MRHLVERVRNDDQDRIGRARNHALDHRSHDRGVLGEKIHAAHAGLTREPRGDHHDVAAGGVGVVVRADDRGLVPLDRGGLLQIEGDPLRLPLDDVDEHDLAEAFLQDAHRGRLPDEAAPHDGDLHLTGSLGRC
jgi:hypothetical protein